MKPINKTQKMIGSYFLGINQTYQQEIEIEKIRYETLHSLFAHLQTNHDVEFHKISQTKDSLAIASE